MTRLYVLELFGKKYYVGLSDQFARRLAQHIRGEGSKFSKLHGFRACVLSMDVPDHMANRLENDMTCYLMARFGWQNVRGGDYVRCINDDETYWLPPAFKKLFATGSAADVLKLRSGTVSQFLPEFRGLVDRFCAVCGS